MDTILESSLWWQKRHEVPLPDGGALTICRTSGEIDGGALVIEKWGRPGGECGETRCGFRLEPCLTEETLAQEVWRLALTARAAPARHWHYVSEKLPNPATRVRFWVRTDESTRGEHAREVRGWYRPEWARESVGDEAKPWWGWNAEGPWSSGATDCCVYAWEPEPEPPPLPEGVGLTAGPPQTVERRCLRTGNPCGTDTWTIGRDCACKECQSWLKEREVRRGAHGETLDG